MSFTAKVQADISQFDKNIDKAIDSTNRLEKTVAQKLSDVGDSFINVGKKASMFSAAVGATATAVVMFAKKTGDMANDLLSATIALDSSADILQEYKLVSIEAGTSTDAFSRSVESLTRRLKDAESGGDEVTEYIDRLGVSLFDASGNMRRMGDITDDIIKSLAEMENVSQRNVIASQLFGRQWVDIAPILALGAEGIDNVRKNAHDLGVVLDGEALNAANRFSIEMNKLELQLTAVKDSLAAEIAPMLSDTLVPILEDKVVPAVRRMAEGLGNLVDKFNNLSDPVKNAILALGGVAVAIGPVMLGLGWLLKTLPLIKTAIVALTGPVGIVVAAVAAAVALIVMNWDSIKEYFTTGGGAETFAILRDMVLAVKDEIVGAFTIVKDTVTKIWDAIGKDVMLIVNGTFKNIAKILEVFVKTIKNVVTVVHGIFTLDFKLALDGLKNLFSDIFRGIMDIVLRSVATLSSHLSTFFGWLGLNKWSEGLQAFSDKLMLSMQGAAKVTDEATESIVEQTEAVDDLNDSLKKLSTSQAITGATAVTTATQVQKAIPENIVASQVIAPVIEPTIDSQGLKEKLKDVTYSALADLGEGIRVITIDISAMMSGVLTDVFGAVSDAIVSGDNMIEALGASLLGTLGSIMVELGQMVIATGTAIEAVKVALKSLGGLGAIAAGAALIAIGSLFSAGARKLASTMGGGAGGGYSSSPSMANTSPEYGPSEYRGAYQDDFTVTFKIGNDELVGTLNTAEQRRKRL